MGSLVSVIIPLYNRADLIEDTLNSLIAQTYPQWEAIVVDDGSTDHSVEVVGEFSKQDSRIRLIKRNKEPKGAPTCRNIGTEESRGAYLIFLDSDDLLSADCIRERLTFMELNRHLDFAVFPAEFFRQQLGDHPVLYDFKQFPPAMRVIDKMLHGYNPWSVLGTIWKREAIRHLGGFDEKLKARQVLDLNLRALLHSLAYEVVDTAPDCFVRMHQGGTISQTNRLYLPMIESREYLGKKIVSMLKQYTEEIYPAVIPVFLVPVVIDYAKLGHFDKAKHLYDWIITHHHLSRTQKWYITIWFQLIKLKVHRVKGYTKLEGFIREQIKSNGHLS